MADSSAGTGETAAKTSEGAEGKGATQAGDKGTQQKVTLTIDELKTVVGEAVDTRLEKLKGSLFAAKRHSEKAGRQDGGSKANETEEDGNQRNPTLTDRVAAQEQRTKRQDERDKLQAITSVLTERGLTRERASREARLILLDHGDAIEVDETDFSVRYRESEEAATPIDKWLGAWLTTDEGKHILPGKKALGDVKSGQNDATTNAKGPDFSKLSYQEIMKHRDGAARAKYMREHATEWAQKKTEHFSK